MIAAIRLFAIAFVVLSAIYVYLSIRQRMRCRRTLEAEFDAGGIKGSREDHIRQGMQDYQGSLRRRLVLGVYIVPLILVVGLIYIMNFM